MEIPQVRSMRLRETMEALAARRTTATALTRLALARARACSEPGSGSFQVDGDPALSAAAESDRRYGDGTYRYLEGLPIAVPHRAGAESSRMLGEHGAIAIGFPHGPTPAIAQGAVAAGLDADEAALRAALALHHAVVEFTATQGRHRILGSAVDDIILLAGAMRLGAPWRDAPARPALGILPLSPGLDGALQRLRGHMRCRPITHRVQLAELREAFRRCDDASVDCLLFPAGPPCDVAGFPTLSMRVPVPHAPPFTVLQLVGRPGTDGELLQIAERIEHLLIEGNAPSPACGSGLG